MTSDKPQNIALACDWLTTPGGAEKVLLELHRMYPAAPIYTSQYSKKGINWFDDADIRTGWLQIFPAALRKFLGPLRQLYFSHLNLTDYDLVISVTGAEAKSVSAKAHLCYCHVPTQYYWQMYDKYVENPGFGPLNPLVRFAFKLLVKPLRKADYKAAQNPTQFITISSYAAEQIKKYYHRDSVIIAPPVEIFKFSTKNRHFSTPISNFSTTFPQKIHNQPSIFPQNTKSSPQQPQVSPQSAENFPPKTDTFPLPSLTFPQLFHRLSTETNDISTSVDNNTAQWLPNGRPNDAKQCHQTKLTTAKPFVISCRQVTWKRVDLAIKACLETENPLLVIGDGPEHKNLVKLAKNSSLIAFIPWLETSELAAYLQNARAYLFPSLEPFGIAAVEALAAGCPVIAYAEGGSRDFIHETGPGKNGLLFPEQTVESLAKAIRSVNPANFDPKAIQKSAKNFSPDVFQDKITALVDKTLNLDKDEPLNPVRKPSKPSRSKTHDHQ